MQFINLSANLIMEHLAMLIMEHLAMQSPLSPLDAMKSYPLPL